jgi:NADPH:quinone reductase-like Zn-dependent oxidoreductase
VKAVVHTRHGPPGVLRLTDVPTPVPKDNKVLVRVAAVSLNRSDWETLRGTPLYSRIAGPFRPRHHILGSDSAGRVQARRVRHHSHRAPAQPAVVTSALPALRLGFSGRRAWAGKPAGGRG